MRRRKQTMSDSRDESVDESFDEAVDEGVDVETPSVSRHVCDVCGKEFDSFQGLRMHKVRVHHSGQGVGGSLATIEAQVPDALSNLNSFLRIFGLSPKDSEAVCKYMENFDLNDLNRLNAALRDVAMPLPRRRLLIESWANVRNIQVPLNLQKELNIQPMPSFGPSPYGPYEQPQPKREDLNIFSYLIEWERLKRESQPQQPQVVAQTNNEELLREELNRLREEHRKEVEDLKRELQKEREERLFSEIRRLEDQIKRIESKSSSSGYSLDEYRLLSDLGREIASKNPMQQLLSFIDKRLPELMSYAYGIPQEKMQQPPQARLGLMELLRQRGLTVPQ